MLRRTSSWGRVIFLARKAKRSRRGETWTRVSDIFWPPVLNKAGMPFEAIACKRLKQFWTKKFLLRTLAFTLLICGSARQSGIWNQWYCCFITHCTFIASWVTIYYLWVQSNTNTYVRAHYSKLTFILYLQFADWNNAQKLFCVFCTIQNPHLYSEK